MKQLIRFSLIAIAAVTAVAWRQAPRRTAIHELTIVARDYGFDAPDSVPAGITTIHLENHGPGLHHVEIVRLDSGHTTEDFIAALATNGPLPTWATYFGGPNVPVPGTEATATLDLAPGHYLVTCLVHSPDSATHRLMSHAVRGMVHPLTVTGTDSAVPLPRADMTITLVDYGFGMSQPLVAGKQVIRVRNAATQFHEIFLVRLAPGKTVNDVPAWVHDPAGPPPAVPLGGLTPISSGVALNITVDLAPGEYGLICFIPDPGDGKPHFVHGMMRQITVGPTRGASPAIGHRMASGDL